MRAILQDEAFLTDSPWLSDDDQSVIDAGWMIGPSGSLLLTALWGGRRTDLPAAEVGPYEYEVNDANVPLDDLMDDEERFLGRAASRALHFAGQLLGKASNLPGSETLQSLVSIFIDKTDEDFALQGANVKFFTRRGEPLPWLDDLEKFQLSAIAVMEVSDLRTLR
jgi:hypothetical protein